MLTTQLRHSVAYVGKSFLIHWSIVNYSMETMNSFTLINIFVSMSVFVSACACDLFICGLFNDVKLYTTE